MNKLLSISISCVILMQSFGITVNDIYQIDEFIEHAKFHSENYGDNIFVFISKHYGELKEHHKNEHHDEKSDHEKLPFSHNTCSHISSITDFVLNSFKADFKVILFSEPTETNFFYQASSSSLHKQGLFQPPQHS